MWGVTPASHQDLVLSSGSGHWGNLKLCSDGVFRCSHSAASLQAADVPEASLWSSSKEVSFSVRPAQSDQFIPTAGHNQLYVNTSSHMTHGLLCGFVHGRNVTCGSVWWWWWWCCCCSAAVHVCATVPVPKGSVRWDAPIQMWCLLWKSLQRHLNETERAPPLETRFK